MPQLYLQQILCFIIDLIMNAKFDVLYLQQMLYVIIDITCDMMSYVALLVVDIVCHYRPGILLHMSSTYSRYCMSLQTLKNTGPVFRSSTYSRYCVSLQTSYLESSSKSSLLIVDIVCHYRPDSSEFTGPDSIVCHYRPYKLNGTKLYSTYSRYCMSLQTMLTSELKVYLQQILCVIIDTHHAR